MTAVAALTALAWQRRARGVDVELATVREGVFEELLVDEGRTRARWHEDLTAPVAGTWTPVGRLAGDSVRAGTLLGTLTAAAQDPATTSQLQARVGVAQAAVEEARAALAAAVVREREARRALERTERLSTSGGVSEEQQEIARATHEGAARSLDAARARVAAAQHEVEAARAFLPGGGSEPVQLRAPAAGVILRVDEEHRRVVPPGTPLLQIGALGDPEVVVRVLSADAPRVRVGATLYAIVGGDTLRGHVTRIEPSAQTVRSTLGVDEQRVPVIGDLHSGRLTVGHDFAVDVRIVLRRLESARIVPTGALARDGDGWRVFAVDADGVATERSVTVIARGPESAAIEGLEPGERVVVYPPEALRSGDRVR
ncbi:efflux RND transporter periplasmic adaptor subunit [Pseudogemmatithrix spongiicola]|uniref:Efflux RND transporter periplasmic adaptor subunit n=1 Tax=Pseudogemmatithrix spongiicola TaxID=3062599 RepID=A0AA49Q649_9BACT|nr:efflux RND transporter periplasmic adaptor subunit [Gemmatimonadaceae bacterium 'strain 138']WKW16358.1 efflux RND transporter periplasmic adaptor subunit [Gemmatimonadaceae bacterium 'strain 318']